MFRNSQQEYQACFFSVMSTLFNNYWRHEILQKLVWVMQYANKFIKEIQAD